MLNPERGDLVTVEKSGGPCYLNFEVQSKDERLFIEPRFSVGVLYLDALTDGLRITNVVKAANRKRGSQDT